MNRQSIVLLIAALFAMTALITVGVSDEESEKSSKLSLSDLPKSIQKAIRDHAGTTNIDAVSKEKEHGTTVYEAEYKVGDVQHEVVVTAKGVLVETESIVSRDDVPKDIRTIAEKHFPAGTKVQFELKHVVHYEAEAIVDGKEIEVVVTATGRIIKAQDDDDDDDGDDDDGDDDDGDDDDGDDDDGDDDDGDDDDGDDDDEKLLSLDDCPAAVIKTIKHESNGGRIEKVERDGDEYEAEVKINGKIYEITVRADGTLVEKSLEDG